MTTYIALLRGINVSGHRMIKMDELKKMLGDLNFTNIRTYIQSGNIIFDSEKNNSAYLEKQIEEKILNHFDFHVPVVIRTRAELDHIHNNNPFLGKRSEPTDKLHVTFFPEEPEPDHLKKIERHLFLPDEFIESGREVYLFCPNGYGRTKLTNQFFESKLKLMATTRNWRTIETLLQMSCT
jgi:uncharacterized protein (DUF1697 family)